MRARVIEIRTRKVEAAGRREIRRDDPELCLYRVRTEYLLRKYARLSVEVGRLPSLLGREFFRTHVLSSHARTFEDLVIFVHDVERSVEKLDGFKKEVVARIALEEHTVEDVARLLGCGKATISRQYTDALDDLSVKWLRGGLLEPFAEMPMEVEEDEAAEDGESWESEAEAGGEEGWGKMAKIPNLGNVCQEGKIADFLVSAS
jgi:hypothetical protein